MCAHNQLFLPAVAAAKAVLDSGRLGRVYEVRTTDCFYNDFDPANMGWRASAATSGGGELIDTGYHPTYLMLHLAGAVPVEAAAMLSTHRLTFAEGEDSAQVVVRFENGAIGTLWTSWAYDPPEITERFSVVAENGTLHSDGTSLHVRYRSGETSSTDLRQGRHLRRRDRPLRRLPEQRHPSAAHREGGHRGARDDPGRLRVGQDPDDRPGAAGPGEPSAARGRPGRQRDAVR